MPWRSLKSIGERGVRLHCSRCRLDEASMHRHVTRVNPRRAECAHPDGVTHEAPTRVQGPGGGFFPRETGYASLFSSSALSVRSQVNSGRDRPK
jgi:hypothetical protein